VANGRLERNAASARAVAAGRPCQTKAAFAFQRGAADGLNIVVPFGEPNYTGSSFDCDPQPSVVGRRAIDLDGFFGLTELARWSAVSQNQLALCTPQVHRSDALAFRCADFMDPAPRLEIDGRRLLTARSTVRKKMLRRPRRGDGAELPPSCTETRRDCASGPQQFKVMSQTRERADGEAAFEPLRTDRWIMLCT